MESDESGVMVEYLDRLANINFLTTYYDEISKNSYPEWDLP